MGHVAIYALFFIVKSDYLMTSNSKHLSIQLIF